MKNSNFYSKQVWNWLVFIYSIVSYEMIGAECATKNSCYPHFAIKEEYLYFQPFFDNVYIPNPNVNGPFPFVVAAPGSREKNEFDYESGYRFSAFYFNPNTDSFIEKISVRFTYLPAHHSRKFNKTSSLFSESVATEDDAVDPINLVNLLTADHHLHYYAGDLFITHSFVDSCRFNFSVQLGLHYSLMHYRNHVHFSAESDAIFSQATLKEKSQTWGLGPQLGFDLNYTVSRWLTIKGLVKGGLLISRSEVKFRENAQSQIISFSALHEKNGPFWRVLPFWEGNVALSYSFPVSCYAVELEVGYEYLSYPDFIRRIRFEDEDFVDIIADLYSNVAFQGPYVALTVGF